MWRSAWVLRAAGLSAIVVASAVLAPVAASAVPPDHGTFSSHEVFVDSEVCAPEGFSVDVVEHEVSTFRVFFDRSGEVAFVSVHGHQRNSKLQLTVILAPPVAVPGLYVHPDHRRRLRRLPVRSDFDV
jgi:hypothetical protein